METRCVMYANMQNYSYNFNYAYMSNSIMHSDLIKYDYAYFEVVSSQKGKMWKNSIKYGYVDSYDATLVPCHIIWDHVQIKNVECKEGDARLSFPERER